MKIIKILMLGLLTAVLFNSCSSDDEVKGNCYFTLGFGYTSTSASGDLVVVTKEKAELSAYEHQVWGAYLKALGMTEDNNTILTTGEFKTKSNEMMSKFNATDLPEAPVLTSVKYSFSIELNGSNLLSGGGSENSKIASKVFTNK